MKKLLLMAAGALLATSLSAADWVLVGAYNGWDLGSAKKLTENGESFVGEIENLTPAFKIVNAETGWEEQFGTTELVNANTPVTLTGKVDGKDPSNIAFFPTVLSIKNATVTWTPSTAELLISAAEADIVIGYPDLWVTGIGDKWPNPGAEGSVKGVEENGIYTFILDLGTGGTQFKIASENWSTEFGSFDNENEVGYTPIKAEIVGSEHNFNTELEGEQTLMFNINDMTIWFVDEEEGGETNAVSTIVKENDADVIYNINGVKVNRDNMSNGIYIVNGKKVVVRK